MVRRRDQTRVTSPESVGLMQMTLPIEKVNKELDEHLGKFVPLPFSWEDIGGEVLSSLSKGLYTDPLDCIREYIQNAVDAGATSAIVKITGDSVHIFDDGDGMSFGGIVQARQFGLSRKDLGEHIGFRGIGLYSSFHLCNRLRITSKEAGDTRQHVLVIEFGDVKEQLDRDARKAAFERKTPLVELLSANTKICRLASDLSENDSFTHIELQEIRDAHVKKLANREELKQYMIRNLPIDFDPGFVHREEINRQLHLNVPGYKAITVTIQADGVDDLVVTKPPIPHLQTPKFGFIGAGTGKTARRVGYYWACLNQERDRIAANARFVEIHEADKAREREVRAQLERDFAAYEGFLYKWKGFTVGNRDRLRHCFFPKPQLYPWYTGEVYVVDTRIVPKADRGDFETDEAKDLLDAAVLQELSNLEDVAEKYQATGVADERVSKYLTAITDLERRADADDERQFDDVDALRKLHDMLKDIKRQLKKTSPEMRATANDVKERIDRLQDRIQKRLSRKSETQHSETPTRRHTRSEETRSTDEGSGDTSSPNSGISVDGNTRSNSANRETETPHAEDSSVLGDMGSTSRSSHRRLTEVLLESGWYLKDSGLRLVELFQQTLDSVLLNNPLYDSVLADLEDRLANEIVPDD